MTAPRRAGRTGTPSARERLLAFVHMYGATCERRGPQFDWARARMARLLRAHERELAERAHDAVWNTLASRVPGDLLRCASHNARAAILAPPAKHAAKAARRGGK